MTARRRQVTRMLRLAAALIFVLALGRSAQAVPALGPADGAGLPPTDIGRVKVGKPAPDFTLDSKDGGTVILSSFRGRKNVVLVFYRGHW